MDSRKPSLKPSLRLQHFLALCGLGSRRACERLIDSGRVAVDRVVVRRQGVCVHPAIQRVEVDGRPVRPESKIYLLLNKSRDIVCTASDPQGRRTFRTLLPSALGERVFTVGRLDQSSEGLLVVTNDGELAHALMHPRHNVEKLYYVWTRRPLTPDEERRLRHGVRSKGETLVLDELTRSEALVPKRQSEESGRARAGNPYCVRIREGRNRHIRRMFEAVGVGVVRLKRVAVGPLKLGSLRSGGWRYLEEREVRDLWDYINKRSVTGKKKKNSEVRIQESESHSV